MQDPKKKTLAIADKVDFCRSTFVENFSRDKLSINSMSGFRRLAKAVPKMACGLTFAAAPSPSVPFSLQGPE